MVIRSRSANELDRLCLDYERSELLQREIIVESAEVKLQCRHVKVAVAKLGARVVECQHMLDFILIDQILRINF